MLPPSFVSSAAVCLLLRAELHWEPGWLGCRMFAFTSMVVCSMGWNYMVSCNGVDTHYFAGPVPFWHSLSSCCFWTKLVSFKMLLFHKNRKAASCTDIDLGAIKDSTNSDQIKWWLEILSGFAAQTVFYHILPKPRRAQWLTEAPLSSAVTFWSGSLQVRVMCVFPFTIAQ